MKVVLRIHSLIDIITNSSTEIFVAATEHTIENVKKLTDALLAVGGSTLKAEDLFTFNLMDEGEVDYASNFKSEMEEAREQAELDGEEFDEVRYREDFYEYDSEYSSSDVKLVVELKEGFLNSPEAETAAKIMSSLTTLFSVGERYDG